MIDYGAVSIVMIGGSVAILVYTFLLVHSYISFSISSYLTCPIISHKSLFEPERRLHWGIEYGTVRIVKIVGPVAILNTFSFLFNSTYV